ncbi:MAG: ribonuclease [Xanthobacteraceae bacterium]|nr:ribonuclease [Xanthobacteraceae bacterium]
MANKMLIDSTHPEETRVVVVRGNRVEEFDFESANRKQIRGNIYLAKVTRVEPSLQAAFVEYGGNRHGFLAFSEIHPDYYQIPVADRQALIDEDERAQKAADAEADNRAKRRGGGHRRRGASRHDETVKSAPIDAAFEEINPSAAQHTLPDQNGEAPAASAEYAHEGLGEGSEHHGAPVTAETEQAAAQPDLAASDTEAAPVHAGDAQDAASRTEHEHVDSDASHEHDADEDDDEDEDDHPDAQDDGERVNARQNGDDGEPEEEIIESVGGADAMEEVPDRPLRGRRQYKIQEVIKRRQVMLVQVVKEERGTKGAALTTYLSLAGRYSVLMPNTARGGGISRKITDSTDRRRLKEIAQDLEVPEGMGVILRTAGANRTKTEVKRDFEYLMRMWETVRDLTLRSSAPMLVYEEGSLIKRSIRDLYNKDIDEVIVAGDEGFREAKDFMRMLMPSHAKNVKLYKDSQPLLSRYGMESQLDAMFQPTVQLKSGGYIVINQTEALVAIDVNSGRATREHHIEDTALKTNLEASEEVARQLRLRDLAGLIVIDYIDMDEKRNNRAVERRMKECLKHDRARIQVGHISHFGLLEMSRQRIRTSVLESSTEKCPHCGGLGHVRSVSSVALQLLRTLEESLMKGATHNMTVRTRPEVALYVLNQKRGHLRELEQRFHITITVVADESIAAQPAYSVDRGDQAHTPEAAKAILAQNLALSPVVEEEDPDDLIVDIDEDEEEEADTAHNIVSVSDDEEEDEDEPQAARSDEPSADGEAEGERGNGRKRRRRRRGRRPEGREDGAAEPQGEPVAARAPREDIDEPSEEAAEPAEDGTGEPETAEQKAEGERRRRRRGRRGGRRNRRGRDGELLPAGENEAGENETSDAAESEVGDAVASFDDASNATPEPAFDRHDEAPAPQASSARADVPRADAPVSEPSRQPEARQPEAPAATEAPRRRSTVREPAPVFGSSEPAAPPAPASAPEPTASPAPAEPEAPAAEDGKPRRSGWWSRRIMGNS